MLALGGGEEGSFGETFQDFREASWVLRLPLPSFGAICPLGLLGAIITLGRRRSAILPLFMGAYLVSLLPFFAAGRYRLPLVPPMLILSAEALCWIDEAIWSLLKDSIADCW